MSLSWKILILLVLFAAAATAVTLWFCRRRGAQAGTTHTEAPAPEASEEDQKRRRELYAKAQRVEQEMILLTGGKTGMLVQRDCFLHAESPTKAEEYRESFEMKQKKLKEAYERYYALQKMEEQLPGVGKPIPPLRDEARYVELMHERLCAAGKAFGSDGESTGR